MHEKRNFTLILLLVVAVIWAIVSLFVLNPGAPLLLMQKILSIVAVIALAGWVFYALMVEDKLPNHLAEQVGDVYYGADGVSFMPIVRVVEGQAELCVYYQNRFENPAQAIVHLRPPEDSFIIRAGMEDVHFTFKVGGGDFGVIHQPIAVPKHLQGEVIRVQLAAVSYYPRSKGARMRKKAGISCGTMPVDWGGAAFKTGVHEVSGEVALSNPATLNLAMPGGANDFLVDTETWRQECIAPGQAASGQPA